MSKEARSGLPFGKTTPIEIINKIGEDGLSGGIEDVCIFPTYSCNLNCYMCHVQHVRDKDNNYISMDDWKAAFDNLNVAKLFYLGGEPFVRNDMMELLELFDEKGINQIISTNGQNVTEDMAKRLANLKNLACVQVSLNGMEAIDGKIRGSQNAYKKTVEAIKILKNAGIQTWIHAVILNENIDDLVNIVKLGAELKVDMINYLFGQVMSEEDARETKAAIKKWTGEDVNVGGYVGKLEYTEEQLVNSINAVKEEAIKTGIQVMFFPRIFGKNPEMYYRGTLLEQERPICQMTLMPPLTPIIGPEGDVIACCIIDKSFGNIKEQSLEEIWDSELMRNFRKGLINDKLMAVCKRCPSGDLIDVHAKKDDFLSKKKDWSAYLNRLTNVLNNLSELPTILETISPVIFQYHFSDRPDLNYWHYFKKEGVSMGLGEIDENNIPKLIHKTDFDTHKNVNAGTNNPIQATMEGIYAVDGDMTKLMACAPLIPITTKAHNIAIKDFLK